MGTTKLILLDSLLQEKETWPRERRRLGLSASTVPGTALPSERPSEDGDLSARQVHLFLLRKGKHEEKGCRHLELWQQQLPRGGRWRRLELVHHRRRVRAVRSQTSA